MKNPLKVAEWSISKVILTLWIIFSIVFIGYVLKNTLVERVYNAGYNAGAQAGQQDAVLKTVQYAQKCQPIILTVGDSKIELMNVACKEGAKVPTPTEKVSKEKK